MEKLRFWSKRPQDEEERGEQSWRVVWTLAWPAVALNSLQTINSLLDGYFVQTLHPAALTALGASTTIMFLFFSMSIMMGTASTALVSRAYGAEDVQLYRESSRKALSLAMYVGLGLVFFIVPAAHVGSRAFIPADDRMAMDLMVQYLSIFALSLPAMNLIQTIAGSLRGIGDTVSPMILSGLQILLHILLNYLLIFPGHDVFGVWIPGANMGLQGAAAALTISAWAAAIAYLAWSKRTKLETKLDLRWPGLDWARRIMRIALPSGMMSLVRVTSLMAFTMVLKQVPLGSEAIGSLRIGFSIESLAFMPAFGLSIAASALVGQSLGREDPERANRLAWTAGHHAAGVSTFVSIFLFIFALPIASFVLADQPQTAAITADYLRFIAVTEIFFAYAMVMIGAMQGAGDTIRPLWISAICMWGLRVPLAYIFAIPVGMGYAGCWLAMAQTQFIQGIISMVVFKRGAWRHQEV